MSRHIIPLGIFVALVALLYVGLSLNPREVPSPLIDKPAPAFSVPGLMDPQATVSSDDLRKDVTLFNVWASWCVACRQEHPLMVKLSQESDVTIYGLNYKDQRADALRWLEMFGNPYKESAFDLDGKVGFNWGVYGVPETFVVDKRGMIRYKHIGPISPASLRDTILPMIEQLRKEQG